MKPLVAVAGALLFLAFSKAPGFYKTYKIFADTSHVVHVVDGSTTEWPDSAFHADKETLLNYAADNDGQSLFIALRIADFRAQMKVIRQGMKLFVDMRGKKKENMGIEYPIKVEGSY